MTRAENRGSRPCCWVRLGEPMPFLYKGGVAASPIPLIVDRLEDIVDRLEDMDGSAGSARAACRELLAGECRMGYRRWISIVVLIGFAVPGSPAWSDEDAAQSRRERSRQARGRRHPAAQRMEADPRGPTSRSSPTCR